MPDDWPNRVILGVVCLCLIGLWLWVKSDEQVSRYRADYEAWTLARDHHDGLHADADVAGCEWCGK